MKMEEEEEEKGRSTGRGKKGKEGEGKPAGGVASRAGQVIGGEGCVGSLWRWRARYCMLPHGAL